MSVCSYVLVGFMILILIIMFGGVAILDRQESEIYRMQQEKRKSPN